MAPRVEPQLVAAPSAKAASLPLAPPAAAPQPNRRRANLPGRILRWLLLAIPGSLLLVLLLIVLLRWVPPPTTSFMLQSPTRPVQYHWVPATAIAETARRAVVASEDQKFWSHNGFDMEAIEKAQVYNRRHRHRRGASTISQQTAKNLFLWPGGGYFRKGVEAVLTVLIEHLWGKPRILEVYLNTAEFGRGVYGVEAASQAFFGKPAAKLSASEAARLAAVLPNPRHWNAKSPGSYVQARAAWILGQMGYGSGPAEEPDVAPGSGEEALPPPSGDEPSPGAAPTVEAPDGSAPAQP